MVWEESLRQAVEMGKVLRAKETNGSKVPLLEIQKALSINVISHAGFGTTLDFRPPGEDAVIEPKPAEKDGLDSYVHKQEGHTMSFSTALDRLTEDFRLTIMARKLPPFITKKAKKMATVNTAYTEFGEYLHGMLRKEESVMAHSERHNLLSQLIRSNAADKQEGGEGLNDDEVLGNTFLFVAAGHETTSVSVEYALMNLALHQDKQDWFIKQLDAHLADMPEDPTQWSYDLCKRLSACACVMYESLRLFPPVPTPIRTVAGTNQLLKWGDKEMNIPGGFVVALNIIGLHTNPKYWGEDAVEFKPERWSLSSDDASENESPRFNGVKNAERATFLPWVEGFRACLGRRFAEVEIVAVLAVLFKSHRVRIKVLEGETQETADKRAKETLGKSSMQMNLAIRKDIELSWVSR